MTKPARARVHPDLLTPLATAGSFEEGLGRALRRLLELTGTTAGALVVRPEGEPPIVVTAGRRRLAPDLDRWLRSAVAGSIRASRLARVSPPGGDGRRKASALLRTPLGAGRAIGDLALFGRAAGLRRTSIAPALARELGTALEQVWRRERRTLRITILNDLTRLLVSSHSLDEVFRAFGDGLARLVAYDALGVSLLDVEREEFEVLDLEARAVAAAPSRDTRMPLDRTLFAQVVVGGEPLRIDDLTSPEVPEVSRRTFGARGYRSAVLVPLVSRGGVFGAVTLASRHPAAFRAADVEVVAELARPLASALEQRRLLDESRRRADELAALYTTSQLITARLDVASVLDRISRSVTALIGSTGCGIGLLQWSGDGEAATAEGGPSEARAGSARLVHAAAHGFKSEEWRALSLPVGEGIIGRCAETGVAIRVDDVRLDPRSARRDVDEREGIRSMLCVPLRVASVLIGVISAFATRPAVFTADHQRVLEAFAEQAGIAIGNARLFEESLRRARETRALLEAGRAVTASLDVTQTIRVIMEEARSVLGVESCSLATLDAATGELVSIASLDLPPEMISRVRLKVGEGIAGLAVQERRPVHSADLFVDSRVRYPQLPKASGFRSMLAAPLRVGERAIGAISVFRLDVHRFSPGEEELLLALADQAAIALEHARLYTELEAMVAERTRELNTQKRFVEVVLETLPLGVFVLDAGLTIVRANREGGRLFGNDAGARGSFVEMLAPEKAEPVAVFLRQAFGARRVAALEEEMSIAGEVSILRLTVAPFDPAEGDIPHVVVLVEDITHAKRLERQMLAMERLTTAGRMAAGVAHELNNPLATIAGCAESLLGRLREGELVRRPELDDFRHYLGLIEEEAYRCKEITGSLLQFVREPGGLRAPTDLNALVLKTVELLGRQSRFSESRFTTELEPDLPPVTVNEGQLRQVFLGLAANALEAMEGPGTLTLRSRRRRGEVEVEFEDEGPGIPDELLSRIFDPFFTTKPPGQGTGLGLAIAQGIVVDHGGRIEVTSRVGKGSLFRVVLSA